MLNYTGKSWGLKLKAESDPQITQINISSINPRFTFYDKSGIDLNS